MTDEEKVLLKQFQPVTIRDDLMFGTVMADPEYCKPFLETILGARIKKIEYPERQFKALMRYIEGGEAEDLYTRILEKKVSLINSNDEWKVSYMTWAIKLADERREGREEGNITALYGLDRMPLSASLTSSCNPCKNVGSN